MRYNINLNKIKKVVAGGLTGLVLGLTSPAYAKDNYCHKWKFDNQTIEVCIYDENNDGKMDRIITSEKDSRGNHTKTFVDEKADGKVDRVITSEYDDKGNEIRRSYDKNNDGKMDQIITFKYDDKGGRLRTSYDDDADGKIDRLFLFSHNSSIYLDTNFLRDK